MPTNRKPLRRNLRRRISPAAVAAWQAADFCALHSALGLLPWEMSPLPDTITALGVSEQNAPLVQGGTNSFDNSYAQALELQRELLAIAGWPDCRAAYEENLREAESMAAYYLELVEHPERGGQGTGCDPASRAIKLKEARSDVAYRKRLLSELNTAAYCDHGTGAERGRR